jgi:hypothetical protein
LDEGDVLTAVARVIPEDDSESNGDDEVTSGTGSLEVSADE